MISVKGNGGFFFLCHSYRERLSILVRKIYSLSHLKIFRAGKLGDLKGKNSIGIRHAIGFFRHQMYIYYLSHFHICHCCVKATDHLACTANKFQRFSPVIRRIKLGSVIKGSSIMGAAGLSYVASCKSRVGTAGASAVSAGMAFFMVTAAVSFFMMMVTVGSGGYQLSFQVVFHCLVCISLSSGAHLYSCFFQSSLGSSPNASADQHIYILICQQSCKSAVTGSVGSDHFTGNYFVIFNFIHLKKFCFSKMLEDVSIVIGYSYLHVFSSSFFLIPASSDRQKALSHSLCNIWRS